MCGGEDGTTDRRARWQAGLRDLYLGIAQGRGGLICLTAILLPNFIPARNHGSPNACKSNLKNLSVSMEMYAQDWGHYPSRGLAQLTPKYLKAVPKCPAAGTVTYTLELGPGATYNTQSYQEYYLVRCAGENHLPLGVPADYPQYSGILGLIER